MLTASTDMILASAIVAAFAVAAVWWSQRRKGHGSRALDRDRRYMQAWSELQQHCLALVEQDERGGAEAEALHRAVARYNGVIGDPADGHIDDLHVRDAKQVPLLF